MKTIEEVKASRTGTIMDSILDLFEEKVEEPHEGVLAVWKAYDTEQEEYLWVVTVGSDFTKAMNFDLGMEPTPETFLARLRAMWSFFERLPMVAVEDRFDSRPWEYLCSEEGTQTGARVVH